jgi:hypothetical protein
VEFDDTILESLLGRDALANTASLVTEVFFGSLFQLGPLWAKEGLFGAVGVDSAWNITVDVLKVRELLLVIGYWQFYFYVIYTEIGHVLKV